MHSNITAANFQSDYREPDERPGTSEVARRLDDTIATIESIDSPADMLAEELNKQVSKYDGPMPKNRHELCHFVVAQFRSAAGPTAVSAMLEAFVAHDEGMHIAHAVRKMLILIQGQARPGLTCEAIGIAMGNHIVEERSLEKIAKKHHITKQALSKRAIRICMELGIPPSPYMRSVASRESYRIKQKQRHAAARAAGMGDLGNESIESIIGKLRGARKHESGSTLKRMIA